MNTRACRGIVLRTKKNRRPMRGLTRRKALVGLLPLCIGISAGATETQALGARLAAIHVPSVSWQAQQSADMSGVPIYVRPFSSTLGAMQLARSLAAETGRFQRLTTFADTLLLSGLQPDAHWLAKIDVSATGSSGYVSVLASGATVPARVEQALDLHAWLPADASAIYRHRSASTGRALDQYIYSVSGTAAASMAYVRQQLRRQGWKDDPSFAKAGGGSAWRRKGSELMIFASARPQGTALYIQHLE